MALLPGRLNISSGSTHHTLSMVDISRIDVVTLALGAIAWAAAVAYVCLSGTSRRRNDFTAFREWQSGDNEHGTVAEFVSSGAARSPLSKAEKVFAVTVFALLMLYYALLYWEAI